MSELRVHLFGGFLLEREAPLPPIASRVGRSLFAHLIMRRGRPVSRDVVAGMYWPDMPDSKARRRLSHALWQIQDVVGSDPGPLSLSHDTLVFDTAADYWLDVEEFERRSEDPATATLDDLRRCVELYRGDFLAGFSDDWVLLDQDRLRRRYVTVLERLVEAAKGHGAYDEALGHARQLTHHDPLNEEAHREVMRLLFLLDRSADAIQQYDRLRSILEDELGAAPSAPTEDLRSRILRQRQAGIGTTPDARRSAILGGRVEAPFVGRASERRDLVDVFEHVLAGAGGVVLVEGEPGVGKTRLALEASDDARWRGYDVAWGSCSHGGQRPFGPLADALSELPPIRRAQLEALIDPVWAAEVGQRVPVFDTDARAVDLRGAEASQRVIEAFVTVFDTLGRLGPQMVVIDDLQWADPETLSVLADLGGRLAETKLLLVLLYRSEEGRGDPEVWDVVRRLDRDAGLGRLAMTPLSVFELDEMVGRLLGSRRIGPAAGHLHRRTGGNALFALETILSLRDVGRFEGGADPASVLAEEFERPQLVTGDRVKQVVEGRLALLGDDVRSVFETAAVWSEAVGLPDLLATTDLPRQVTLSAVDDLLGRGLLTDDADQRLRVSHDHVRQVTTGQIDPARQRDLHRAVGDRLADVAPSEMARIGHHLASAGEHAAAAHMLLRAGRTAASEHHAYASASRLLSRADAEAAAGDCDVRVRTPILLQLEESLDVLGRREEQREVLARLSGLELEERERITVGLRTGMYLAHLGDFDEAEALLTETIDAAEAAGDRARTASARVALGRCIRWSGRPLEAIPVLSEVDDASAEARIELASTLVEVGRSSDAIPHLDAALASVVDGDRRSLAEVLGVRARALRQTGANAEAAATYRRALAVCREIGYRHGEGVNLVNLANLDQLAGSVADSLAGYDAAAAVFARLGNRRGEAMVLANAASARHHVLGADDRAHADASRAAGLFEEMGDSARVAQCMEVVAGVMARQGRVAEARELLADGVATLEVSGNRDLMAQHLRALALVELESGDVAAAVASLDAAERVAIELDRTDLAVDLATIRAMALVAEGRPHDAFALTSATVARIDSGAHRPYEMLHRHALAARAAGRLHEAERASIEARERLDAALVGLSAAERDVALERVPVHRAIVGHAEEVVPVVVDVRLPHRDAPLGRAPTEDEMVDVRWTIEHPADASHADGPERRRVRLLRLLSEATEQGGLPPLSRLADALAVSEATVRRDLAALRTDGHELMTRGSQAS